jgi:hypothetical protein
VHALADGQKAPSWYGRSVLQAHGPDGVVVEHDAEVDDVAVRSAGAGVSWSWLVGQVGSEVKVYSGC